MPLTSAGLAGQRGCHAAGHDAGVDAIAAIETPELLHTRSARVNPLLIGNQAIENLSLSTRLQHGRFFVACAQVI